MKTLLEWLEENRSTLKDGLYNISHLNNIFCNQRTVALNVDDVKRCDDVYQVKDGVITLYDPKPVRSLDQWLNITKLKDGLYTYDTGVVYCDGEVFAQPVHLNPTLDEYRVIDGVVTLLTSDPVNSPSHYASGDIECIDAIKASMTREAFMGYLKGNIQKYMWRYEKKVNPIEDVKKARWYMNKLVDELDT